MPAVGVTDLIAELTGSHGASRHGRGGSTSFVLMHCEEGFKCISQVEKFGLHHDGVYKGLPLGVKLPPEYKSAYEWGCPARGTVSPSGECADHGTKDTSQLCWSLQQFEAGKNSPCKDVDDCKCVKPTENGNTTLNNKYSVMNQGKEVRTQKYLVQPKQQCDKCEDHDCNPTQCNRCEFCEYTTKTFGGRRTEGCFTREKAKAEDVDAADGRPYLDGDDATEEDLIVIPHYKFWDPGATRGPDEKGYDAASPSAVLRFPHQNRSEPLSKEAWLSKYKEAAPRIQRLMDAAKESMIWAGQNANTLDCKWDLLGRVAKFKNMRRDCKLMQTTVDALKPRTEFAPKAPDAAGKSHKLKCHLGKSHKCDALNCYYRDKELTAAFYNLAERNTVCKSEKEAQNRQLQMAKAANKAAKKEAEEEAEVQAAASAGSGKTTENVSKSGMDLSPTVFLTIPTAVPSNEAIRKSSCRHETLKSFL